ncbi:hypothetical protein BIV25_28390 [Streptomyces sp. MUSC 14]|uniref:hypothetical protein n=1 Tax=Streptomyces sp. MUSC 14 TaxID=1354889 RepID=UPI0008F5CD88|nr:hypothetical protein [Streptomyces sp. MUSC 14]OIJ92220.1 hypothetical protein BIV25_28390 [Streptomyces sp. MUSC 14]
MLIKRTTIAGTALLLAALTACGGHTGTAQAAGSGAAPTPVPVTGLRDTVRHVTRQTTRATRPHLVRSCTTRTHRVRHSTRTGTGSRRRTRTWYTTDHYQDCHTVRHGTDTYRRVIRPERWCVRLDDVNGNRRRDDVWYQVTHVDYDTASTAADHTRLRFVPLVPDDGC